MKNNPEKYLLKKYIINRSFQVLCIIAAALVIVPLLIIFIDIIIKGFPSLSLDFITEYPEKGMTAGGIMPAIIGTVYVTLLSSIASIPIGIMTGIYLAQYAKNTLFTRIIKLTIRNLAGIPSIVYGIFGMALFVDLFGFGGSILSAGLTLGLLTLPWIISTTEEALKRVPESFAEASLGLGATKWQTIRKVLLPSAGPGIITGIILGIARAAGETAPILFTGAAYYLNNLPGTLMDKFMALPYHIFSLATQHAQIVKVRPIAYGATLILILFVFLLSSIAFFVRQKLKRLEGGQ
ncbi:MAG TPA: phosphate ABC transporter permease PtsA [Spirochaetia bacterium]|nr:MAG: phosphate ABC transporter, permease protein PstA [Spirochaetes bacterium GWB1_36_13]HCL56536.1 phosphate ABC transporter permease PtsA [Spirochaetia bacterium]